MSGIPARSVEGRVPARQCLGRRGRDGPSATDAGPEQLPAHQRLGSARRAIAPDADGWQCVLPQHPHQPAQPQRPRQCHVACAGEQNVGPLQFPAYAAGRCFKCLATGHRVATCNLPWRCLCCHGLGHLARECKRPRRVNDNGRTARPRSGNGGRGVNDTEGRVPTTDKGKALPGHPHQRGRCHRSRRR
jgi:hypothetical protein